MAVIIENRFIDNTNFSNNPIESSTGIVSASITVNFIDGGDQVFRFDVIVRDHNNVTVITQSFKNKTAGSVGGQIVIPFLNSFQMGDDFPPFVTIQATIVKTNPNLPDRVVADVTSDQILFTGFGAQNKLISVIAENGQSLNNFVVTQSDFDLLVTVLPSFNATITGSDTLTASNTTAVVIIEFASANQITQLPSENMLVQAIAENGFETGGTVTNEDWLRLIDPITGVSSVKGTITGVPNSLNISTNFTFIMNFLRDNQVIEPPPQVTGFTVIFDNGSPSIEDVILTNSDLVTLRAQLPNCASIIGEFSTTNSPNQLSVILNLVNQICAIIPPIVKNICFCVSFKDASQLCFVLNKADFDFLVANPVKLAGVGDQYVIVNESECEDTANNLSDVFQEIFDQIKKVNEDFISPNMVLIQPNPFVINDNNTFTGSVKFIATESFNSFFYGKNIVTVLQIKDKAGVVLNQNDFKINNLNFTETERDEIILYTEFGAFSKEELTLEFFVFDNAQDMNAFAIPAIVNVTKDGSTMPPTNGDGGGLKFGSGGILTKVVGGFFGLLTLCLLTPQGRK